VSNNIADKMQNSVYSISAIDF